MLTTVQQHAVDQFGKRLVTLGDDALIDTYHQAWEDHRAAHAEGSDSLGRAYVEGLATEMAMRDRFPDYQGRYRLRLPVNQLVLLPISLNRQRRLPMEW
jgi:hypothetical protein